MRQRSETRAFVRLPPFSATQPSRREWLFLPHTCRSQYPSGAAQLGRVEVWRGGCSSHRPDEGFFWPGDGSDGRRASRHDARDRACFPPAVTEATTAQSRMPTNVYAPLPRLKPGTGRKTQAGRPPKVGKTSLSYRHRDAVETPPQPCGQKPFTYWMRCGSVRLA